MEKSSKCPAVSAENVEDLQFEGGALMGQTHVKGAKTVPHCDFCPVNPCLAGGPKEKVPKFFPNTIKSTFCCYDPVMWSPMGSDKCGVSGCSSSAFNTCDESYPYIGGCWLIDGPCCRFIQLVEPFKGCGRKICIEHSYLLEAWNPNSGPWCLCVPVMQGFSCTECTAKLNAAFCCRCGPKIGFTGVCSIF